MFWQEGVDGQKKIASTFLGQFSFRPIIFFVFVFSFSLFQWIWSENAVGGARLGIPTFGSDFWNPHWRWNSDSVYDSEDSGRIFFEIPISGEPENKNSDLRFLEFRQFLAQELSTSFCR